MMREDQVEEEGFSIIEGRKEGKERVRTHMVGKKEVKYKPLPSPSPLASQSRLQLEGHHLHQ